MRTNLKEEFCSIEEVIEEFKNQYPNAEEAESIARYSFSKKKKGFKKRFLKEDVAGYLATREEKHYTNKAETDDVISSTKKTEEYPNKKSNLIQSNEHYVLKNSLYNNEEITNSCSPLITFNDECNSDEEINLPDDEWCIYETPLSVLLETAALIEAVEYERKLLFDSINVEPPYNYYEVMAELYFPLNNTY